MTPNERLNDIEKRWDLKRNILLENIYNIPILHEDMNWLIARTKKLTEALQNYCECAGDYRCVSCKTILDDE